MILAGARIDDRLIGHAQLVVLERALEMALQSELLERGRAELRDVALDDVAPLGLGAVHRRVGALQQPFRLGRVGGVQADAEAGGDEHLLPVEEDRTLHRGDDALRHHHGVVGRSHVGAQHGELVATQPGHRILATNRRPDAVRDRLQEQVAGRMAERVVDRP